MRKCHLTTFHLGLSDSLFLMFVLLIVCSTLMKPLISQTQNYNAERKVVTRVEPDYPDTLKRLYIGGTVRVEVVVTARGTVESMQLVGGNPILGQSAMKAIKYWKFAAAKDKSTFVVPLTFDPHR